jgi:hypothetical protein
MKACLPSRKSPESMQAVPIALIVSVRFGLPLEEATGTFPSRVSVVDDRLKREGKDSPNKKYRSRSALLQERASKLVSGSGELTTRVDPAMIGCEARHLIHVAAIRQHLRKPQNDTQIIWGGYILMIGRLLHEISSSTRPVRDIRRFMTRRQVTC